MGLAALALLFLLSGASALVYQVLWLRLLGLVFGVTVYAASTVWAAFMGGLALGSFGAGRVGDRVRRPLLWFAAAEACVGLTALMTPLALGWLQQIYAALHPALSDRLPLLTFVRFAMTFAVLIVPTALMGATLPLVLTSTRFHASGFGMRVGVLYAANTTGAIAGSLVAGLILIPRYGIRASFFAAAAVNLLVAAVAAWWGREPLPAAPTQPAPGDTPAANDAPVAARRLVLWVFAVSGFVSLAVEVIWFRVLTLFLRPTVYGYSMMLAAMLGGISAGSYVVAPLLKRRFDRLMILGWLEAAIAICALASFAALDAIPWMMGALGPAVATVTGPYLGYQAIVSLLVILPTSLLLGAAFPIGLQVWVGASGGASAHTAERTGSFYSLNVAGAILGSLCAGFLMLPWMGSRQSLLAMGAITLLSGVLLTLASAATRVVRYGVAVGMLVLGAATAVLVPDPFDAFLRQRYRDEKILWRREAVQTTVSVHERPGGDRTLNVSGNHQASTGGSTPVVHRRIGHLGMALHPDGRDALVIGLGGGATAGALSQHTGVDVDVVELSPEVATAAGRFFTPINNDVLRQPNVHLKVDDGRNFLMLATRRYDVITADVILPIYAGSGNLYSAEYFALVRKALKPGGLAVQWVAGTDAEYRLIARTFLSVFPHATAWGDGTLLVGSTEPLRLRPSDFDLKMALPRRRAMLAELGVRTFDDLLALYRAGPDELRRLVGEGPLLTDDRPLVEYFLSLPRDKNVDLSMLKGDVRRHVEGRSPGP